MRGVLDGLRIFLGCAQYPAILPRFLPRFLALSPPLPPESAPICIHLRSRTSCTGRVANARRRFTRHFGLGRPGPRRHSRARPKWEWKVGSFRLNVISPRGSTPRHRPESGPMQPDRQANNCVPCDVASCRIEVHLPIPCSSVALLSSPTGMRVIG